MRTGPKYKIARRLGDAGIFSKTSNPKFALSRERKERTKSRGKRRGGRSEYGTQLIEKQKVRYTYGINERQLSNYVKRSRKDKKIAPGISLYKFLESRLDNVVYKLGFASTRSFARQMVSHGHIMVNKRRVTIPSFQVSIGDTVTIREQSKSSKGFVGLPEKLKECQVPAWAVVDIIALSGKITKEIGEVDEARTLNLGAVIEFYSRV